MYSVSFYYFKKASISFLKSVIFRLKEDNLFLKIISAARGANKSSKSLKSILKISKRFKVGLKLLIELMNFKIYENIL